MGATEQWLASLRDKSAARVGAALSLDGSTPDAAAEADRLGKALGVPANVVSAAPDTFRRQHQQKAATDLLKSAPLTAKWLQDRQNGTLAKDDLETLTWFERDLKTFGDVVGGGNDPAASVGRAVARGGRRVGAILPQMKASKSARMLGDMGKSLDDLVAEEMAQIGGDAAPASMRTAALQAAQLRYDAISGLSEDDRAALLAGGSEALVKAKEVLDKAASVQMSEGAQRFRDNTLANSENSVMGALKAFVADPVGGAAFVSEVAAEFLPAMAAGVGATIVTRSPAAGAAVMGISSGLTENTNSAMEFLAEQGIDLSTPEAAAAVLENTELMQAAADRGLTRGLVIGVMDAMSGGVAGQTLMKSPVGDMVAQGLAQVAFGAGGEALGQFASGQDMDWREVVIEGLAELVTAPVEVLGIGGRGAIKRLMRGAKRSSTAETLAKIDEVASASKLKQRSPEKWAEALEAQGLDEVYVPADKLREFFQAKDMTPDAWGFDPDVFGEQAMSGQTTAIPLSTYASKITGTDAAEWVKQNAVSDPDELSLADARAFNDEVQDALQQAREEAASAIEADRELRAADAQIYDDIFFQLRSAGRSPDVAQNEARVMTAFWRTMGERYGEDPLDLARSMGLRIQGPQADVAGRLRGDLDLKLNTLRKGDPKPTGQSLMEFVRAEGGVSDAGGDVEALSPPKGVVAETSSKVRERRAQPSLGGMPSVGKGIGLDEMARKAKDAGYFPENAEVGANDLLDALREEAAGRPVYIPGEGVDPDLAALQAELNRRGIDLALSNDEIVAALGVERGGVDGREFEQGKRGSIVFPSGGLRSGETVINLFEQANLSTFLHESSHYFLEAFAALADDPSAPQQMRDDMAAIREWLDNDGGPFTTEQHEQWARGGEAYFMDGKAPSLALADAFARFKAWLTRIYRSIAGLNVKITPEIREVMDRMLATDAEIAEARSEAEMRPLFSDAPAGMAKSDFDTYRRMARRSTEKAEQTLLEKTMAKVRREREVWFRAEKKAVREEVEASMNKRPVYRLTEALANGRWIGSEQEIPDMRIDKKALVEMFGDGVLPEISRTRLGGKRAIYKDGGEAPQDVARFFGFANSIEMVETLQNAGKRKDAINAEVDRIMTERHGDPMNDGSIEEEALAAIHNEQQANTVAAEVRHLAGRLGRKTGGLNARIYRQRAKAMLGKMRVRDAAKSHNFLAAERRAAKNAERAFAKVARSGGETALAEAYQAKEQQLLNHMLYMESREFEKQVQRGREKMRSYAKKSVRSKLEGGYIEQIDALLDRFDFRVRSAGQVARTESLADYVARMTEEGREAELSIDPALLDEARRMHYSRMTVDEIRGLFDTIANIDHMGRFKQTLIEAKRRRDLAESVSRVVGAIRSSQKPSGERHTGSVGKALNLIWRPDTIIVGLDGGEEVGAVYEELKRGIDEGQAEEQAMQVRMAEQFDELFNMHYTRKQLRAMTDPKAIAGVSKREWSKQEIIALALNTGAEENFQRVMDGNVDPEMSMDLETLHRLLSTLDENDWRFVQGMWDMVNSYWPDLASVYKRRTGVEPAKVQAKLMYDGAPDFVRGGYYPIKYDATRGRSAARDEASAWDRFLTAGHGSTAAVRNGMTKERQKTGGGRTIKYDLTVPFQHLKETVRYIALSEAVDNAYRVLNHEETVQALQDTGNEDTLKTLNLWIKDTAQGPIFNTDLLNTMARMVKNNFTLSRLSGNLKTVILQATGLGQSAATIGKENMVRGMMAYMKRPNELISEVVEKSPFMTERQTTFQKDIYDFANDVKIQSPLAGRWARTKKNIAQVGFWPMVKMQFLVVDMPTWLGAYRAGLEKYNGDDAKAVLFADRMVARAQDSGMFADRSGVERGTVSENVRQADFIRLFTTLGGYMLTKLNRVNVTALQARKGIAEADSAATKAAVAVSAATDIALLLTFEPILMGLLYSMFSDDDEPEDVRDFIIGETGMAIFGGVPIVRDIASSFQGYGSGGIYGSVLEMPYRLGTQLSQGENDKALRRAIGDMIGTATGLPTTATLRLYEGILGEDGSSPAEILMGSNPLDY